MNFKYKVTLFTPTYNRAYILETLYRSVQRQTFKDFEWLVIDDGSTDNTEELVKGWMQEENFFPIRYCKVPNGGKCRAINKGLDLAEGELFFIMDSDDYLTDDAMEKIADWDSTLRDKQGYCGYMGQRGISPTETPNRRLNAPYRDGTAFDRYPEHCAAAIDGERADVWFTEIYRQFKYPEIDGERFMTECVAWNRMAAAGYKTRFFDDIIWIYEYMPDGLTKAGFRLFAENPRGYILAMREKSRFLNSGPVAKLKCEYSLYCDLRDYYSVRELQPMLGWGVLLEAAFYWVKNAGKGKRT